MRIYPANAVAGGSKKLRRLPHVFSKMIELPFGADADVYIEEDRDMFRFFAAVDGVSGGVRAHAVVVHPGVMKVVVLDGTGAGEEDFGEDELEFDRWRFRLPQSTLPRLATAEYVDGELIVTVPKGDGPEEREGFFEEGNGGFCGSAILISAGNAAFRKKLKGKYQLATMLHFQFHIPEKAYFPLHTEEKEEKGERHKYYIKLGKR